MLTVDAGGDTQSGDDPRTSRRAGLQATADKDWSTGTWRLGHSENTHVAPRVLGLRRMAKTYLGFAAVLVLTPDPDSQAAPNQNFITGFVLG